MAVQAVLGLVEPQSSGLGGGAFLVWWDAKRGAMTTLDGRETAQDLQKSCWAVADRLEEADKVHVTLAAEYGVHILAASGPARAESGEVGSASSASSSSNQVPPELRRRPDAIPVSGAAFLTARAAMGPKDQTGLLVSYRTLARVSSARPTTPSTVTK